LTHAAEDVLGIQLGGRGGGSISQLLCNRLWKLKKCGETTSRFYTIDWDPKHTVYCLCNGRAPEKKTTLCNYKLTATKGSGQFQWKHSVE